MNKKGYTLIEVLMASALMVLLTMVVYNFYNATRLVYTLGIYGQALQDGVNIVLSKISEGTTEPGGVYRLSQGVSYCIGTGPSCGGAASIAQLHYWGPDGIERWYRLDNTSTSLIYHHPTNARTQDETIYTAPAGATLTLRFWIPNVANYSAAVVGIDAALTQNSFGRIVTGASTTVVTLRGHP